MGYTYAINRLDEWIGEVHIVSPTPTSWPEQGIVSDTDLGARPKVAGDSQISTLSVKGRVQGMISEQTAPMAIKETRQEMRKLLGVATMTMEIEHNWSCTRQEKMV